MAEIQNERVIIIRAGKATQGYQGKNVKPMQAIRINYKKNKQMNYWLIDFVNDKRKNSVCFCPY
jgi:hypothetical protein